MKTKSKRKLSLYLITAVHLLFWIVIYNHFSTVVLVLEIGRVNLPPSFISESLLYGMGFNAGVFYLNYRYLIDKYMPHQIAHYLIASSLALFAVTLAETAIDVAILDRSQFESVRELAIVLFLFNIKVHFGFWLIAGILKTALNWSSLEKTRQKVQSQQIATELALLKSQIHPHFLFNTLNTLYSSAYEFGDKETAEGIGKLSHLLRYMLYETKEEKVLVEKEIEYLENYIDLQKMRFTNEVSISFTVEGKAAEYAIAPMLLITLVENAFKHGISPAVKTDISLNLKIKNEKLVFQVENARLRENKTMGLEGQSGGLGLINLQKRLTMIYPQQHDFKTFTLNDKFIARLELT